MKISEEKKNEFWDYFTSKEMKSYRPYGVTDNCLKKAKPLIWNWNYFWEDVVVRHGGLESKPEQMDEETFNHSIGNFYGMVFEIMTKYGIIK
ncbi:hypothetical protein C4588_02135 [Candidatus Parcubacteria bacterium]|nr:MAG: hypothetical protein C4588_02135 [Candidatus Parcubacteria bacterium]